MANNLIQIKRSLATATPGSLANGELAYTANGDVLFIGSNSGVVAIGGARNPGVLTANQALIANSTLGIDRIVVANAAVTRLTANGASAPGAGYYLAVDSGGNTYWAAPGTLSINVSAQYTWTNTHSFTNTTSSSSTTTGAVVIAGGLGVGGRINTLDLAAGNSTVYTTVNGTSVSTVDVFSTGAVNAVTLSVGGWVVANNGGVYTSGGVNAAVFSVGSSFIANSTGAYHTGTVNAASHTIGSTLVANSTGVYHTGTVNAASLTVGTGFIANTTRVVIGTAVGLQANGGIGTAGQVLTSNATTVYWSTPTTGTVTSVATGNGLSGGPITSTGTIAVVANSGIAANSTGVFVVAGSGVASNSTGVHVVANSGITSNATGVYVAAGSGIASNSTGVHVVAGTNGGLVSNSTGVFIAATDGLVSNSTGLHVGTGNGISVATDSVSVAAGAGIASNSTGVHVVAGTNGGLVSNSTGVFVTAGSGLVANATGVHVGAANGINVQADTVGLTTGSTLTVNATGAHVNSTLSITSLSLSGDLTVAGNVTTTNVNDLVVSDPLIHLAANNETSDLVDIGFIGHYSNDAGVTKRHIGFFRDATDGVFKLFANSVDTALDAANTVTVNTAATGYTTATLQAFLTSGGLVSNSTAVTLTANSTLAVNLTANSLTLTTPLAATSGGVGIASYTSGDILVANTGNTLSKLSLGTSGRVLQSNGTALVYDTLDGGTF